jgi:hypothetical protein
MKRVAILITLFVFCGAAWLAIPPAVHVWKLSDASTVQERRFADWFHSFNSGLLAVRITGNLAGPAQVLTPLGPIELPRGDIDFIVYTHEAWSSSATVRYSPSEDTKGHLMISVCLGSNPTWVRRPPPSALPALYTGGWTAYYPGTDKKAWTGGFHHGIKWGEFTYWDEGGKITHREEWENGKIKG